MATPFVARSHGEELALCQRYYQVSQYSNRGWVNGLGNMYFSVNSNYIVQMRAVPSMAFSGGTFDNVLKSDADPENHTSTVSTVHGYSVIYRGETVDKAYRIFERILTADAEL